MPVNELRGGEDIAGSVALRLVHHDGTLNDSNGHAITVLVEKKVTVTDMPAQVTL